MWCCEQNVRSLAYGITHTRGCALRPSRPRRADAAALVLLQPRRLLLFGRARGRQGKSRRAAGPAARGGAAR
eukprot:5367901-Prymnesium_polylepis.1